MKLLEITRPSGDVNTELSNVVEFFPKKALIALVKSGGLKFGDEVIFDKGGNYTEYLEGLIEEGKNHIYDSMELNININAFSDEISTSVKFLDDDEDGSEHSEAINGAEERRRDSKPEYNPLKETDLDYDAKADDAQETFIGYTDKGRALVIGFDVWLKEDDFNEEWDPQFREAYGVEFDYEDPEHEKIFNKARKIFMDKLMMWGVMLEISPTGKIIDEQSAPGGFHRNSKNFAGRGEIHEFH